ncbi:hypothetical protein [Brasilonema bromeliae]|uniref:hypothetical protein n=1 Tax=Brasilonema bromeliae TaxID=383615 RepID=UPI001B7D0377|nr:hypothetical protein [Brasilonema bromeliae]
MLPLVSALIVLPVEVLYKPRLTRLPLKTGLMSDLLLKVGSVSPSKALADRMTFDAFLRQTGVV